MKKFKLFALLILMSSLIMGSCKKDDDKDSDSGNYYFNVTIDGEKYHLDNSGADIDDASANIGGALKDDATNALSININLHAAGIRTTGVGTYTPTAYYDVVFTDKDGVIWYYSSGNFQVADLNLENYTVKGTFNSIIVANGTQTLELKDGSFYMYLIHV